VDTWVAFDNRRAIFPIHRSMRFLLLSGAIGGPTDALPLSDGGSDVSCLTRLPDDPRAAGGLPHVMVSRAFLESWDPAHLTVPHVASETDIAVAVRSLDAPRLGGDAGWGVTFGRELNASDDRRHFTVEGSRRSGRLPVIEGKHLRPFGVDLDAVTTAMPRALARARLGDRWAHARVCYRDVASASNRVTLIAAVLPAGTVSTHTVFCARTRLADADAWCLTGLLNSLVANYLVRLQMNTHVTTTLMARLPVPRPGPGTIGHRSLVECARRLARCHSLEDDAEAYARLNAVAARLYGLTPTDYAHVVSTFPLLPAALRERCVAAFGA
jgi:hypothetical protein